VLLSAGIANASYSQIQASTERGSFRYVYAMLFKLYDLTLHTDAPRQATPDELLNGQYSLRLEFSYLRTIEKSIILESAEKMLLRNVSPDQYQHIAERVERLNTAYTTVHKGDQSALSYQKGIGTQLEINGEHIVTITGDDFAPLYFRIWLGEQPISTEMRDTLVAR
jgi:hypothetical protein